MYKVFNMGHRMEVYLDEKYAQQVINISKNFGVDAQVVGRVEKSSEKQVTIKSSNFEFTYY